MPRRSATKILIGALRVLAQEIESPDGVANAAIAEAAVRLQELRDLLQEASGQMSRGKWSSDFRARVEQALK